MPKLKLTAAAVARLTPPPQGRIDYFDANLPAFGLRLSHTGARKYFVMTRVHGQLSRLTIGPAKTAEDGPGITLSDARKKAGEWVELAGSGQDPRQLKATEKQANAEKSANTFPVVADRFMKQHVEPKLSASSKREYRAALFGKDLSAWQNYPVSSITRADVRTVLDAIMQRGSPSVANHMLAYLSKFFNWCAEKDLLEIPPTDRMKAPAQKTMGERTLSETEIVEVWKAFEAKGESFRDLFKLLLLTGQRRSEVGNMTYGELVGLDGDKPTWEIPGSRTKNGRPHSVPLSKEAVAIITNLPIIGESGLLFTTNGTTPISAFSKAKGRIDAHIAEERKKVENEAVMPEWDLHDLRRTMVTMMNERLAIAPHVVEACVNHVSGGAKAGVAGVYNKALYLSERRTALQSWATYVTNLVAIADAKNVVKLAG